MSNRLTGIPASEALEPLRTSQVALLTTYRRDGTPIGTPVGINVKQDAAWFTTRAKTWKVKRMRNNPDVTLAPCTKRGKVLGATVPATVRRVTDEETRAHSGNFQYQLWRVIYRLVYRDLPVTYEVYPVGS